MENRKNRKNRKMEETDSEFFFLKVLKTIFLTPNCVDRQVFDFWKSSCTKTTFFQNLIL